MPFSLIILPINSFHITIYTFLDCSRRDFYSTLSELFQLDLLSVFLLWTMTLQDISRPINTYFVFGNSMIMYSKWHILRHTSLDCMKKSFIHLFLFVSRIITLFQNYLHDILNTFVDLRYALLIFIELDLDKTIVKRPQKIFISWVYYFFAPYIPHVQKINIFYSITYLININIVHANIKSVIIIHKKSPSNRTVLVDGREVKGSFFFSYYFLSLGLVSMAGFFVLLMASFLIRSCISAYACLFLS